MTARDAPVAALVSEVGCALELKGSRKASLGFRRNQNGR